MIGFFTSTGHNTVACAAKGPCPTGAVWLSTLATLDHRIGPPVNGSRATFTASLTYSRTHRSNGSRGSHRRNRASCAPFPSGVHAWTRSRCAAIKWSRAWSRHCRCSWKTPSSCSCRWSRSRYDTLRSSACTGSSGSCERRRPNFCEFRWQISITADLPPKRNQIRMSLTPDQEQGRGYLASPFPHLHLQLGLVAVAA